MFLKVPRSRECNWFGAAVRFSREKLIVKLARAIQTLGTPNFQAL